MTDTWTSFKDVDPRHDDGAKADGMFIWAAPKHGGWSLGLGYFNVSGGYSDTYGSEYVRRATHWKRIGPPPVS